MRSRLAHAGDGTLSRYLLVIGAAILILVADQITKVVARANLASSGVSIAGDALRLDYTQNTGAAFSVFQSGGVLLTVVAVAVIAAILLSYRRTAASPWVVRLSLGLIAGGASGNLLDRVRQGYVVDFIHLQWWPVFNLADSAISIGVLLLIAHSLRSTDTMTTHA